jgi:hypothetical protein
MRNTGSLWKLLSCSSIATFVTCLKVFALAKLPRLRSGKDSLPKLRPSKGLRSDLIAYSDHIPEDLIMERPGYWTIHRIALDLEL